MIILASAVLFFLGSGAMYALFKAGSLNVGDALTQFEREEQMLALVQARAPSQQRRPAASLFKTQV